MKVYKLSKLMLIFMFAILLFMTGIGVSIFLRGLMGAGAPSLLQWFFLLWVVMLAWVWYVCLLIPYEISLKDGDSLVFRSVLKSTVVVPKDIISIKAAGLGAGFLHLKHIRGTIRLISQMTGLYELIYTVKSLNPAIEVKGC